MAPAAGLSVPAGWLAVAHVGRLVMDDLREADDRDHVVLGDRAPVELLEELHRLLGAAKLRIVVLDVARRELPDLLDLDIVDHRVEDLLARRMAEPDRHPDDLAALVFAGLVAEANRRGLATPLQLVDEDRRVEVECVGRAVHRSRAYLLTSA